MWDGVGLSGFRMTGAAVRALLRCVVAVICMMAAGCATVSPRYTTADAPGGGRVPPAVSPAQHRLSGVASYYADDFHGRLTSSGERYDMYALTAAHQTLPFNTLVRVTYLKNGRTVMVRINDRGPFKDDRVIDLSLTAARELGLVAEGTGEVTLDLLGNP